MTEALALTETRRANHIILGESLQQQRVPSKLCLPFICQTKAIHCILSQGGVIRGKAWQLWSKLIGKNKEDEQGATCNDHCL